MTSPVEPGPGPGEPAAPSGPRRPPGRYDEEREPRRWPVVAAATAFAIGMTYGVVRLYEDFGGSVRTSTKRMVVEDRSVLLEFDVVKDRDRAATCFLRAVDRQRQVLVERTIEVPAGQERTRVVEVLPTERRATLGEVLRCRLVPER